MRQSRQSLARLIAGVGIAVVVARLPGEALADVPALRWSRPLDAGEGFSRVELPDEVVSACRPGLPDLRVRAAGGAEVPYVLEQALKFVENTWPVRDVETSTGRETTGVIDRGAAPPVTDTLTIDVSEAEFLKPVVIEASDDAHAWREIGRGSIFATQPGTSMTTLRFAPSSRRYFRLRLDDRNGPPVTLRAVHGGPPAVAGPIPREVSLDVTRIASEGGESTYAVTLPAANLSVSRLRLSPTDIAFSRLVSIDERVFVRDEITRRSVGSAIVRRGPDGESLEIRLGTLRGPSLEIRVQDGASPPLSLSHASAVIEPRSLLLLAAAGSPPLTLEYGSAVVPPAAYDLAAALSSREPDNVRPAHAGAAVDRGVGTPVALPPHGAVLDDAGWRTRAAIVAPACAAGGVVYLPLEGVDPSARVRIVDAMSREVPFIFERASHHARQSAKSQVVTSPGQTLLTLSEIASPREIDAIELTATAPEYFVRTLSVVEEVRDARGPVGERILASTKWQRRPGETAVPLVLPILPPTDATVVVRIDDGSNPALSLGSVTVQRAVRRVDFLCAPGETFSLLTGDGAGAAPSYDLALVSDALLRTPAQPAQLGPATNVASPARGPAKWFWAAVVVAGLGVAAALARAIGNQKPG